MADGHETQRAGPAQPQPQSSEVQGRHTKPLERRVHHGISLPLVSQVLQEFCMFGAESLGAISCARSASGLHDGVSSKSTDNEQANSRSMAQTSQSKHEWVAEKVMSG
ncbi:hypothetical protein HC256_004255 [Beauveria bassiana]|nr:hypothetical protein HC256_004255 [Beauveria bassiana]